MSINWTNTDSAVSVEHLTLFRDGLTTSSAVVEPIGESPAEAIFITSKRFNKGKTMKNVILAAMTVLTIAGPASATSDWDIFWGTTVKHSLTELGHTLDPANSGWNDFWYQCQDPNKNAGDCVGTVAAGIGLAIAVPVALGLVAVAGAAAIPAAAGPTGYVSLSALAAPALI